MLVGGPPLCPEWERTEASFRSWGVTLEAHQRGGVGSSLTWRGSDRRLPLHKALGFLRGWGELEEGRTW